jgi:hypothetical protein
MGKTINIFIRHQKGYLFLLFILFVLPLGLFFQFSPYPLAKIQYVFIATLLVSQWYFYQENNYYRKIRNDVVDSLKKELGKTPSSKEIHERSIRIGQHRSVCIGIALACIFAIMLYFQEF